MYNYYHQASLFSLPPFPLSSPLLLPLELLSLPLLQSLRGPIYGPYVIFHRRSVIKQ